jgi:hypothetical protein
MMLFVSTTLYYYYVNDLIDWNVVYIVRARLQDFVERRFLSRVY